MHHKATVALAPGVGAFDYPALVQGHEALGHLKNRPGRLRVVEDADVAVGGVAHQLHVQAMGRLQCLGRVINQLSHTTAAAKWMAPRKFLAVLS